MNRKHSASTAPPSAPQPSEATLAHKRSEERLREVQGFWPEVRQLADTFRSLRTDNHFAERIEGAHK